MRSSIKVISGGLAIFLLAVAPPRHETIKLLEPVNSGTADLHTGRTQIASPRAASELSADLVETDEAAKTALGAAPFEAFANWIGRYETATVKTSQLLAEGERIALDRRAALAVLIETDPEQALRLAIPYEQRKILPPEVARHLEEPVSGYGRYDVIGVAPGYGAPQGKSIERLVTMNERMFKASVYGRRVGQVSSDHIPLHGIAIGESLALAEHAVRPLGAAEAADRLASGAPSAAECPISQKAGSSAYAADVGGEVRYFCHDGHIEALNTQLEKAEAGGLTRQSAYKVDAARTQGEKTLLFIRANFPDDKAETITAEAASSLMEKVNAFFELNSYEKLSIRSTVTPLLTLPNNKNWYRASSVEINFGRVMEDARAVAAAAGFNTDKYDLDCVHLNGGVVSPRGYIGVKGATLSDDRVAAACHELGHNLGLSHANGWSTTDGSIIGQGFNAEYENKFDTMGNSKDDPGQFNACHKYRLNWLPDSAVRTIDQDGIYRLYAYDVPSLELGRTYALRMAKDNDRDYWIETRQNSPLMKMGELLINWSPWYTSHEGTQLLDMVPSGWGGFYDAQLGLGRSFYDPDLGIKIIPLARNGTSPESVDVMVKHVHYLASFDGADVAAPGFTVDVEPAGQYSVWCRTSAATANVGLVLDGTFLRSGALAVVKNAASGWTRVVDDSRSPLLIPLSVGQHHLQLTGTPEIDAIIVTDDPTGELPPVILPSPVPNQVTTPGEAITLDCSVLAAGAGPLRFEASSSNQSLVTPDNIVVEAEGSNQRVRITPAQQQLGATMITLSATTEDGRSAKSSFMLTVISEAQAAFNARAVAPQLSLRSDGEDLVVGFNESSPSAWVIQATSDFSSWETVGMLRPGQTLLRDATVRQSSRRFYRAIRY